MFHTAIITSSFDRNLKILSWQKNKHNFLPTFQSPSHFLANIESLFELNPMKGS